MEAPIKIVLIGGVLAYLFRAQIENALGIGTAPAATPVPTSPTGVATTVAATQTAAGAPPLSVANTAAIAATAATAAALAAAPLTNALLEQATTNPATAALVGNRYLGNIWQWNWYYAAGNPTGPIVSAASVPMGTKMNAAAYQALRNDPATTLSPNSGDAPVLIGGAMADLSGIRDRDPRAWRSPATRRQFR
jgi:hypothetical protein